MPKEVYRKLYISGTGRCGTNLIKEDLLKHKEVAGLPFEHRIVIDPNGIIDTYHSLINTWSPYLCHQKISSLLNFLRSKSKRDPDHWQISNTIKTQINGKIVSSKPAYAGWELSKWFEEYDYIIDRLESDLVDFHYNATWPGDDYPRKNPHMSFVSPDIQKIKSAFSAFLESCTQNICERGNAKIWADDNTWANLFASTLLELEPNVLFLNVRRNPIDVIYSMQKQTWTPSKLEDTALYVKSILDQIEFQLSQIPEESVKTLSIEEYVENPRNALMSICEFSGIDHEIDFKSDASIEKLRPELYKEVYSVNEQYLCKKILDHHYDLYENS